MSAAKGLVAAEVAKRARRTLAPKLGAELFAAQLLDPRWRPSVPQACPNGLQGSEYTLLGLGFWGFPGLTA